ncbi:dual specificity protein phosphatase family protein [Dechloromonas sp. A34]|uniref:dual specificity protein phosphatase family protein n=1 Tax=Dechloromonas sp. A34 TaxID=447588 RepID=UPI0022487646|nr:dual specificity protein phosphatase family protein [Dechloromonas sp. A34]
MAPYLAAAWLNSRLWTSRQPAPVQVADGVWLGRMQTRREMATGRFAGLLDLTAELPAPQGGWSYLNRPWLDLVPPTSAELVLAADAIDTLRRQGPLLVCCALGYSRSAAAVAAWLLRTGRAGGIDEAVQLIAACRPPVVLGAAHRAALQGALADPKAAHG